MAVQAGIGVSRLILLVGAGYGGTVLLQNRKLSEIIGDIQSFVARQEKNGENGESDISDAIATQVKRLAMEVKQLASARQITVLNGSSGGNVTALIVPAALLGTVGYGYMWWKGVSFSDLMYVTKKSMSTAVSNLTKHLEHVSDALAATKKHLTQRIENLDGKLDDQIEVSKLIKTEVTDVRAELSDIGYDLNTIQSLVHGLNGKIMTLEEKQDFANNGILYLVDCVNGKGVASPQMLQVQEQLKLSAKTKGLLTSSEAPPIKGFKDIEDFLLGGVNSPASDGKVEKLPGLPRRMIRTRTAIC
ncbi:uncharacterized protein LOC108195051 [Daucus carota subsp. sativus]|uniref:uncharacterized protein LOC108195051 n=1 Tax=Daucus carota subsp. sativus TaxID=79200 RepID=UPI0007F0267B|nr:PREDICTED: uncharacterized protein LOC108195051 [Daucus carota subsp. sativus]